MTDVQPLALRAAPKNLDEYFGQEHLVGLGSPIRVMIEKQMIRSMIFYGKPATGKTCLAKIIAQEINAEFVYMNATTLNIEDIKQIHSHAKERKIILFIDEIHRLTRPKQDMFLESLELGLIVLIGATTENPYFSLQSALRSRLLMFEFLEHTDSHLQKILQNVLLQDSVLKELNITLNSDAEQALIQLSSDPRNMLTILETVILSKNIGNTEITIQDIKKIITRADTIYNQKEAHFAVLSAFIKSVRGSDPDAALYYLAMMIESGEDPKVIFRRILISAMEDVGLAYPEAINVVVSCAEASERIGYPENILCLSQATLYLAGLPKSNSTLAIYRVLDFIKEGNIMKIPEELQHHHGLGNDKSHAKYQYPHDCAEHFVKQEYTEKEINFYKPSNQGFEKKIQERLYKLWGERYKY